MRIKLEVISGPMDGHIFQFNSNVDLGREGKLRIPSDRFISRRHVLIEVQDPRLFLEDLGSTNGTYLNGKRMSAPAPLRRGDRVQAGNLVVEVT